MYTTPADWGITEPMLTVLFSHQEKAIALSDNGELFYSEMPEEYIADAGILQVKMPAYGAMVLHHRARDKYK